MTIDDIEQQELTAGELQVLAEDRERWKRMGAGAHLDEWMNYGVGLLIRRRLAMRLAHTNAPEGRGYNIEFGRLMLHDGLNWQDNTVKNAMGAVLWLHDVPERIAVLREIRETMTPGERARLNSPISARQRVEKVMRAREGGTEGTLRTSPVARLKQKNVELERQLAHAEERLAAAEARDGSLFDLNRDSSAAIATTVVANVSATKARMIATGILAALKAQSKPAG
jgi:hypothetical protein